ncbi:unnamed protein product [Oikopleura dioica]|uniref:Apple domain-containing protein n=1 Tax=Oikopleura dioica TaxID=34765 RepID=E4XM60_OIKDI|nr:unnamed protein product [Oikopleura dioica]
MKIWIAIWAFSKALPSDRTRDIEKRGGKCHVHADTVDSCLYECSNQRNCDCITYYPESKQCQLKESSSYCYMKIDQKAQTFCDGGMYLGYKIEGGDFSCEH